MNDSSTSSTNNRPDSNSTETSSSGHESADGSRTEIGEKPLPGKPLPPNDLRIDKNPAAATQDLTDPTVPEKSAKQPNTEPPPQKTESNAEKKPAVAAKKEAVAAEKAAKDRHIEPLFEGWPQPKYVLLITGQQMGYLEPCGCTGLANQKGGLARRHTLAKELADRGWKVLPVDVGNQVRRFGKQSEVKFQQTASALNKIGYRAIALGGDDLRLSTGEVLTATVADEGEKTPFLCANAAIVDRSLTPTHHVLELGGAKIGVTAILGADLQAKILSSEVVMASPEAGLDAVLPKLKDAHCDVLVLLAHASLDETRLLAKKYPDFQVVITAGGLGEPPYLPETIPDTKSIMVQLGLKGMYAGVLGFFDDAKKPWRYQRVPLDSRFADSPEMLAVLAEYQEQLRVLGFEGLGLKPLPFPAGGEFVGADGCRDCHTKEYERWKETPHSHATDSLVHPPERADIARHFDPECLSCHVTGWNPQQYVPYQSGYLSLEKTAFMKGSGCENCHGPGAAHVAAENGMGNPSQETLKMLREGMRLPLDRAEKKCLECHDIDNSPDFHDPGAFEKYWKQVEH